MEKTPAKIKRPLWVASLNIALALTVGTKQAFATEINSVADLLAVSSDANYVLMVDLDLSSDDASSAEGEQLADEETSGDPSYIPNGFTGTLDGGGKTISGLTKPLFDIIGEGIVVSNLNLKADLATDLVIGGGILANDSFGTINNVNTIGNVLSVTNSVGGLVGYSAGSISDSSATGDVTGPSNVGGLVGASHGSISGSSSFGNVNGNITVGGLVGDSNGPILNSSASGDVNGNFYVGGLVGNSTSSISGSFAEGTVLNINAVTGGLVGYSTGNISNSYATGDVTGSNSVGGLVGQGPGAITNSYAAGNVTGVYEVGGLVGYQHGDIANSYASGNVTGYSYVGGLVGSSWAADAEAGITRSYAAGDVIGYQFVGGLVGDNYVDIDTFSYGAGEVTGTGGGYIQLSSGLPPLTATELLAILNTEAESPVFALDPSINAGRPYLISNAPPGNDGGNDEVVEVSIRIDFSSLLPTQALSALSKSVGFEAAKSDLNKLDLAFPDEVKGEKSAPITGAKLFANQSLTTSLSVGSLLQLEINFEANKSLQMWVKSSDDQYVLVGDITFDKDGNAVLPGIEFKKGGSYEFIFVNSDKKDLTQPELVNKVSGLTVYVNE